MSFYWNYFNQPNLVLLNKKNQNQTLFLNSPGVQPVTFLKSLIKC